MSYQAPVNDILFTLNHMLGLSSLGEAHLAPDLDAETLAAILEEAGKFAADVIAPLNRKGDETGSKLVDGKVVLPEGWTGAYKQWCEAGWAALTGDPDYGGQGLPIMLNSAVHEMWNSANVSFSLAPMLTQSGVEAMEHHASEELKNIYLEKMISGEWTGTMNLTEPHAGSDLGALRCRAIPQDDGAYRLKGTKIFITYGDHEMTDNIIHMVIARIDGAPAGVKGISLFLVPKYLVNEDGSLGPRNDVKAISLEHKLGIHASPTCVMAFGENEGALGYLVGEENKGLAHMFTMMNNARLAVGVQGVAVAEMATQHAIAYANERKQGRAGGTPKGEMTPIINHPDIRRTLMTMRALTQGSRAICLATAMALDIAKSGPEEMRKEKADRAALLTPIAKAFATDTAVEVASLGLQIHGGMGFIEETGAAQYYRDARILPIYEGTNGIQAMDLVGRKLPMEGGAVVNSLIAEMRELAEQVMASNDPALGRTGYRLSAAVNELEAATHWLLETLSEDARSAMAGATPYLRLFGLALTGNYLARGALFSLQGEAMSSDERKTRIITARYMAENLLPETAALQRSITQGAGAALALSPDQLGRI